MAVPSWDDYWAARVPAAEDYAKFDFPILTITGYYDGDQPGAMEYYRRHMRHGSEAGKAQHFLLLGPWDHSGTRIPRQAFGGVDFGSAAMFDAFQLDRDWYRWAMALGGDDSAFPDFLLDRVTWFVAGANDGEGAWKGAPSLDDIADRELVFHLRSEGAADSLFRAGALDPEPAARADADAYVYDPLDTRKTDIDLGEDYILDVQELMATDGDGLIYHSAPFEVDTEITGYIRFEAWFEMDVPDTDINVTLYEVLEDGTSIALTGQAQRARYRDSLEQQSLMTPGEVTRFVFDRFYFISRLVARGSRLRLFIRPANMVGNQRNYNSGGVVAKETAADALTARVRLHMGPDTPSRLVLPVVD